MRVDDFFAVNVRRARENARLNQGEVAQLLSSSGLPTTQQKVARIEAGVRRVSIGEACAIAAVLDTPLEELLEEHFAPDPSLQEALRLLKADENTLTPSERRQREKAVELLASYADED